LKGPDHYSKTQEKTVSVIEIAYRKRYTKKDKILIRKISLIWMLKNWGRKWANWS